MPDTTTSSFHDAARHLLAKIEEISTHLNLASLNHQTDVCKSLVAKPAFIDVALLGQFKAGKSSFINSLIGQDVLPVGVTPVTTVITRLFHEEKPRAVVTHFDGGRVEVPITAIEQFISEEKNPANEKNVEVVDLALPAFARYAGLRFVDTPGLGSVFKYNTQTSQEWLPEVGVAVVAVSSDRPLSENDLNLIRELVKYTPKIALLLTKTDLLTPAQQEEVIRFVEKTVEREIRRQFPVYGYSTKKRGDLFKHRIDSLLLGLSQNRDAESMSILQHKITSLSMSCLGYLEFAFRTSVKADEERGTLKELILTEKLKYDLIRSELFLMTRDNMLRTRTLIAARLETARAEFTGKLMARLREEMPSPSLPPF